MAQMLCVRCKKRPAVVFVQRMDGGETKTDGYCLTCAKELGIKPVDDLMKQFGISDQDLENMEARFSAFMQGGGAEAMEGLMESGSEDGDEPGEGEDDDFTPGGSATFPFNLMGRMGGEEARDADYHPVEGQDGTAGRTDKKDPRAKEKGKKRKFLDTYCENLTGKAQEGKLDQIIGRDKDKVHCVFFRPAHDPVYIICFQRHTRCNLCDPAVSRSTEQFHSFLALLQLP